MVTALQVAIVADEGDTEAWLGGRSLQFVVLECSAAIEQPTVTLLRELERKVLAVSAEVGKVLEVQGALHAYRIHPSIHSPRDLKDWRVLMSELEGFEP